MLLLSISSMAGCRTPDCVPGKVCVALSFTGGAESADALDFTVSLDDGPTKRWPIVCPVG
jgi:hypothetical protein